MGPPLRRILYGGREIHAFVNSGGSASAGPVRGLVFTVHVLWFNETPPGNARERPPSYPTRALKLLVRKIKSAGASLVQHEYLIDLN